MVIACRGLSVPEKGDDDDSNKGDTFERNFAGWDVKNSSWTRRRLTEIEERVGRLPPALDGDSQVCEEDEDRAHNVKL